MNLALETGATLTTCSTLAGAIFNSFEVVLYNLSVKMALQLIFLAVWC